VRSARVRLSLQGVGIATAFVQVVFAIHWATKMGTALLEDGAIIIMAGAAKAATRRVRARRDMRLMLQSPYY
jgi:hypothetical protein